METFPQTFAVLVSSFFIPDVDDCDPNPCLNHGKCVDGVDSYVCKCPRGFAGVNCTEGQELCWEFFSNKSLSSSNQMIFDCYNDFDWF